jgi:hypothetical protein
LREFHARRHKVDTTTVAARGKRILKERVKKEPQRHLYYSM